MPKRHTHQQRDSARIPRNGSKRRVRNRNAASSDRLPTTANKTLPADISQRIDNDPLFAVTTANLSHWIDPYTGAAIPLPDPCPHLSQLIAQHLLSTDSWQRQQCLGLVSLQTQRWRLDLQRLLREDKRFRLFDSRDGYWMNPYTGDLVDEIQRPPGGTLSQQTITAMARHLAQNQPEDPHSPLSAAVLRQTMHTISSDRNDNRSGDYGIVEDRQRDHEHDLERATAVQARMLLPPPSLAGYDIARLFRPHDAVSGDAYDLHMAADGCLHFLVADVAGHGIQGALISAGLLRTVRLLRQSLSDPKELLVALNRELRPELLPGQFITVCVGVLNPRDNTLRVCLAGHHPCLLMNPSATIMLSRLGRPGLVLGIAEDEAFAETLTIDEVVLSPGDLLVQFSDGIIEAQNEDEEFGVLRLATRLLRRCASGHTCEALLRDSLRAAEHFAGGQLADDVTLIGIGKNSQ